MCKEILCIQFFRDSHMVGKLFAIAVSQRLDLFCNRSKSYQQGALKGLCGLVCFQDYAAHKVFVLHQVNQYASSRFANHCVWFAIAYA